jgi:hypothetical protein
MKTLEEFTGTMLAMSAALLMGRMYDDARAIVAFPAPVGTNASANAAWVKFQAASKALIAALDECESVGGDLQQAEKAAAGGMQ